MKLVIALFVGLLSACAGTADLLPKVGTALQHVRDSYNAVDSIETRAATIANAVCEPAVVPPAFVAECSQLQSDLAEADSLKATARQGINDAISVYETVNKAAGGE